MFGIGAQEMVFLAIIALLVFGPKRLPELARTLGRGLAEFRRASSDLRGALSLEPDPPGTPKRRSDVDPREDRDFDTPAPQVGLHESILADVRAAEEAVKAELADEANDEKHREAEASEPPVDEAEGEGDRATRESEAEGDRATREAGGEKAADPEPAAGRRP